MRSDPSKRNSDFWCEFHNDHGHRTSDCRILQGEVEQLLKQGYLIDLFSEKGRQSYMKNKQEPQKPPSPQRTVNVITGGDEVNGVTYTTAKKMSKIMVTHGKRVLQVLDGDSITFDDEDVDDLIISHNDTLVLADFVADFSTNLVPEAEKELQVFTGANPGTWILFTDGSSKVKGAGLGIILIPPSGEVIRQVIKCYPITNNEVEYEAVIAGLELAREHGIE
uniref:RNase H type-1 domain-containing protein n=1 Tax=Nicotiana tabacum TaxID=4097 RepID=A0A1S3XBW0_TOBAC|nr:PREDICTED: uncharacterized protein LOC107763277 [Nicotiana tabacum]